MKNQLAPTTLLHGEPLLEEESEMFKAVVLEEYHDFFDIFSRTNAKTLPPHCPYDHTIEIENEGSPLHGPIYPLSNTELEALHDYLEDMLGKGFICSSQSPGGAPIMFAKKKDGSLRMCVDYRGLNCITQKNKYPIPLILNLIDQLKSTNIYTKFDLHTGFNNIQIASGHEWKTAF